MNTLKYASILNFNDDEMLVRDERGDTAFLPLPRAEIEREYDGLLIAVDVLLNLTEPTEVGEDGIDVPLMVGDKILLLGDQVVGVRLHPKDPRRTLQALLPAADRGNPWDKMLIDLATHHPVLNGRAMEANGDLNQLREIGTSWEWDGYLPDETGGVAGSIPGFKQLDLGATVLVSFFSNNTTPKMIQSLLKGEGRYVIDRGGAWAACDNAGEQQNRMWVARLWDKQMDEEVPRSRFCSWDMESCLSVAALYAKKLEVR